MVGTGTKFPKKQYHERQIDYDPVPNSDKEITPNYPFVAYWHVVFAFRFSTMSIYRSRCYGPIPQFKNNTYKIHSDNFAFRFFLMLENYAR